MAKVEINHRVIRPLESKHVEGGSEETFDGWGVVLLGHTEHEQRALAHEDEFTTKTE